MVLRSVYANAHGEGEAVGATGEFAQIEMRFAIHDVLRDVPQVGWHLSTRSRPMEWERPVAVPSSQPAESQPTK